MSSYNTIPKGVDKDHSRRRGSRTPPEHSNHRYSSTSRRSSHYRESHQRLSPSNHRCNGNNRSLDRSSDPYCSRSLIKRDVAHHHRDQSGHRYKDPKPRHVSSFNQHSSYQRGYQDSYDYESRNKPYDHYRSRENNYCRDDRESFSQRRDSNYDDSHSDHHRNRYHHHPSRGQSLCHKFSPSNQRKSQKDSKYLRSDNKDGSHSHDMRSSEDDTCKTEKNKNRVSMFLQLNKEFNEKTSSVETNKNSKDKDSLVLTNIQISDEQQRSESERLEEQSYTVADGGPPHSSQPDLQHEPPAQDLQHEPPAQDLQHERTGQLSDAKTSSISVLEFPSTNSKLINFPNKQIQTPINRRPSTTEASSSFSDTQIDNSQQVDDVTTLPLDTVILRREIIIRLQLALRNCSFANSQQKMLLTQKEMEAELLRQVIIVLLERLLQTFKEHFKNERERQEFPSDVKNRLIETWNESIKKRSRNNESNHRDSSQEQKRKRRRMGDSPSLSISAVDEDSQHPRTDIAQRDVESDTSSEKRCKVSLQSSPTVSPKANDSVALEKTLQQLDERWSTIDLWIRNILRNCSIIHDPDEVRDLVNALLSELERRQYKPELKVENQSQVTSTGKRRKLLSSDIEVSNSLQPSVLDQDEFDVAADYETEFHQSKQLRFVVENYLKLKEDYSQLQREKLTSDLALQVQKQKLQVYLSRDPGVWELELPSLKQLLQQYIQSLASSSESNELITLSDQDLTSLASGPDGQIACLAKLKRVNRFLRNALSKRDVSIEELKGTVSQLQDELKSRRLSPDRSSIVFSKHSREQHKLCVDQHHHVRVVQGLQEQFQNEKAKLENDCLSLKTQLTATTARFTLSIKEMEEKFHQRQSELETQIVDFQDLKNEAEKQIEELKAEIAKLEARNQLTKSELDHVHSLNRQACATVLEDLKHLSEQRQVSTTEIPDTSNLPDTISGLQSMIANLIRQRDAWTSEMDELGEALEARMNEINVLDDRVKILTDKGLALISENLEHKRVIAGYERESQNLQFRFAQVHGEMKTLQNERDAARSESSLRLEEQSRLLERSALENKERVKLENSIGDYKKMIDQFQLQANERQSSNEDQKQTVENLNAEIKHLRKELLDAKHPTDISSSAILPQLELQSLFGQVGRSSPETKTPGQRQSLDESSSYKQLKQEFDTLRSKVLCCLCHERWKDSLVRKCGHIFCQDCIKTTLSSRNRKCPGCHQRFTLDDVVRVYFT